MGAETDYLLGLVAGLDVDKTSKTINKQLKDSIGKALNKIDLNLEINPEAFKALQNYLKSSLIDIQKMREEIKLIEGAQFKTRLAQTSQPFTKQLEQMSLGNQFEVVKVDQDTLGNVQSMHAIIKDLNGIVTRVKLSFNEISNTIDVKTVQSVINIKDVLNETLAPAKNLQTEIERLIKLQSSQGLTDQESEDLLNKKIDLLNVYANGMEVVSSLKSREIISEQQSIVLIDNLKNKYNDIQKILSTKEQKLIDTEKINEAKKSLKDFEKNYKELLKLQSEISIDPTKDTESNQKRIKMLQEEISESKKLLNTLPLFAEELVKIEKKTDKKQTFIDADIQEKEANKIIKSLKNLYNKKQGFYNEARKAEREDNESVRNDAAIKEQNIDKQIAAEQRRASTIIKNQDAYKRIQAETAKLDANYANAKSRADALQIDREKKKRDEINHTFGVIKEFSRQGEKLSLLNPDDITKESKALNNQIQLLEGTKAKIKGISEVRDRNGNVTKKVTVIEDEHADKIRTVTYFYDQANKSLRYYGDTLTNNVNRQMNWVAQMGHAIKKMSVWGAAARVLYGGIREVNEGFSFVKELDKDLTQVAVVMKTSRAAVQYLALDYAKLGLEMGKTVQEISAVNTELIRQGLSAEESAARMQTVLKLSATGAISAEQSLKVITTAVNAMKVSHQEAADVILMASQISASSVESLGESFAKTASSAKATGMSIEEVAGTLSTLEEVTQEGASELGTALKSILSRFQKVNEETGLFNEDMNTVQESLESVGIAFLDADGQIRNVYDILRDLSKIWPTLTRNQQAYIATQAAGTRMQNRFFAIIENFDRVEEITNASKEAIGTLNFAYQTYGDSVEASANRAKVAMQQLWINTINPDVIKFFYETIQTLALFVDKVGIIPIVFAGAWTKMILLNKDLVLGFAKLAKSIKFVRDMQVANKLLNGTLEAGAKISGRAWRTYSQLAAQQAITGTAFQVAATKVKLFSVALLGSPYFWAIAGLTALGIAIYKYVKGVKEATEAERKRRGELVESLRVYQDNSKNINTNINKLKELGNEYLELQTKVKLSGSGPANALSSDEYERFLSIQNQIIDIAPNVVIGVDDQGHSILNLTNGVDSLTASYRSLIKVQQEEVAENKSSIIAGLKEEAKNEIDAYSEAVKLRDKLVEDLSKPVVREHGPDSKQRKLTEIEQINLDLQTFKEDSEEYKKAFEKREQLLRDAEINISKASKGLQNVQQGILVAWSSDAQLTNLEKIIMTTYDFSEAIKDLSPEETVKYLDEFKNSLQGLAKTKAEKTITMVSREVTSLNKDLQENKITYKEYENEIEKVRSKLIAYINSLKESKASLEAGGEATKASREQIQLVIDGLNSYKNILDQSIVSRNIFNDSIGAPAAIAKMKSATDSIEKLIEAQTELKENGDISIETMEYLINTYPEYDAALLTTKEGIRKFVNAAIADEKRRYDADIAATETALANAKAQLEALKSVGFGLNETTNAWLLYGSALEKGSTYESLMAEKMILQNSSFFDAKYLNDEIDQLELQLALLRKGRTSIDKLISSGSTSGKAAASTKKDEAEITDLIDAKIRSYKALNDEIEKNISILQEQLEVAQEDDSIESLKEQIKIVKQLIIENEKLKASMQTEKSKIVEESLDIRKSVKNKYSSEEIDSWFDNALEATTKFEKLRNSMTTKTQQEALDVIFNQIKKLKTAWKEADEQEKEILKTTQEYLNLIQDTNDALAEQQLQAIQDVEDKVVEMITKRGELERDATEKAYEDNIKRYEDELDAYNDLVDGKIEAYKRQFEEQDYLDSQKEKQDEAAEIKRQIDLLALDDSLQARSKKAELQKKLDDLNKEIAKTETDRERDLIIENLESQAELKEESINEQIEAEETAFKKFEEIWDKAYSEYSIIAEARKAIEDGVVKDFEGNVVELSEAYKTFNSLYGDGISELGKITENEFTSKIEEAILAMKELKNEASDLYSYYTTGKTKEPTVPNEETAPTGSTANPVTGPNAGNVERATIKMPDGSTISGYTYQGTSYAYNGDQLTKDPKYNGAVVKLKNGSYWEIRDGKGYQITDPNLLSKFANEGFASGGINKTTGLAMLHGTKNKPEYIFNYEQFKELAKMIGQSKFTSPKVPTISQQITSPLISIENLINVEGNVSKDVLPALKQVGNEVAEIIKKELNKTGTFRSALI